MSDFFPELNRRFNDVVSILEDEEKSFEKTLDRGIEHFLKAAEKSKSSNVISGEDIFLLYDTYGFPVDLTQLMAAERGYTADVASFDKLMDKKRIDSGASGTSSNSLQLDVNATAHLNKSLQIVPTDDSAKYALTDISATLKVKIPQKSHTLTSSFRQYGTALNSSPKCYQALKSASSLTRPITTPNREAKSMTSEPQPPLLTPSLSPMFRRTPVT
jgi:alanyl-tRNA synthetase